MMVGFGGRITSSTRIIFGVLIAAFSQFAWMAGASADPIGTAESVVPAASYVRGGGAHDLAVDDAIEQDDVIRTAGNGSTQIRFLDDTMLTVAPNAEILLDKGIFDGAQAKSLSVKLTNGAMRFVSGVSSRESYKIETPFATIGVRGTVVDILNEGSRTIVNFVDGSGPICIVATGACRSVAAGEPALAIGPKGFSPATAGELARLWRRLDSAHLALARQGGHDPSAASGAAKGVNAPAAGSGQSSDTTGSIGNGSSNSSSSNSGSSNSGSSNTGSNTTGSGGTPAGGGLPFVPTPSNIVLSTNPIGGAIAAASADTLTYVANTMSRLYGAANPAFTGTVAGLQPGDLLANVTTGAASFTAPTATAASNVGTYAIDGSGLTVTSGSYSTGILQAPGNATALTITPATLTLTYTANPASQPFGTANTTFTGTVAPTGLQNGNTLAGVTTGTAVFTSQTTATTPAGQYPIDGSGLTVTSTNYIPTILQAASNATALTITPNTGPGFPFSLFEVTGSGGKLPIQIGNNQSNFAYAPAATVTYDAANNITSAVVSGTPNAADDPLAATLTHAGGQNQTIIGPAVVLPGFGSSPVPAYFLESWTGGNLAYSQSGTPPGSVSIGSNTAFQFMGWGYTGDLFPSSVSPLSPTSFGGIVTFNLENALPAVWGNGQSPSGTFTTGQVAVAIGTTALYYGMVGTVSMPGEGTFAMSTNGGLTNPKLSGAVGPISGQVTQIQAYGQVISGPASVCSLTCYSNENFNTIAPGMLAVTYAIGNGQNFNNNNNNDEITGIATFTQGTTTAPSPSAGFVSFIDNFRSSQLVATGSAHGMLAVADNFLTTQNVTTSAGGVVTGTQTVPVTNNIPELQSVTMDAVGGTGTLGTATSTDNGSVPGILSWERWTNGTFTTQSGGTINIPANAGLAFIDGQLATNLPNTSSGGPSPGLAVQYSLVGGTLPTVTNGSVAPGTLLNTGSTVSQIGIDFVHLKVGLNLWASIGGGTYEIQTAGGAATPSSSSLALTSNGLFSSGAIPVNVNVPTSSPNIACTAGSCTATVTGFLAGDGTGQQNNNGCGGCFPYGAAAPYLGINYSFGNSSGPLSGFVSGAAAFGRDIPVGNVVGYAFSSTQSLPATGLPTMALGTNGQAIPIGDSSTASGLSLGNISVGFDNNGSNFLDFDRGAFGSGSPTAIAADQGFVSGILSWERWTGTSTASGTVYGCTNNCGTSTPYSLSSSQGIHVIDGVLATNLPTTNVTAIYNYIGGTTPTIADGTPGGAGASMQSNSQVGVKFGANPLFGVNLNVNIASSNFNILSSGGAASPSLSAAGLLANPIFSNSSNLTTTVTSGSGITGCMSKCNASINGFLAGNGASHLGILYQFNTANPAKTVSGAAGFAK